MKFHLSFSDYQPGLFPADLFSITQLSRAVKEKG
jgi:hypothetical protein